MARSEEEPSVELLEACRTGDRAAFGVLFDRCRDRVYSLALQLSGNPSEAGDITQEVFLKVMTRLAQFRSESRFTTWLYRVVVNTFADRRKAIRRLVPIDPVLRMVEPPAQEVDLERAEASRAIAAAMSELSPRLRPVIALRFGAGLSYQEIGEVLGISEGTVASRLSRALKQLGRSLEAP